MAFRILLLFGLVCFPPFLSERLLIPTPSGTGPRLPVVFPEYGESSLESSEANESQVFVLFSLPTVYDYYDYYY